MNVQLCIQTTQLSDYIFISLQQYNSFDSGIILYLLFR